jgi:hypothetical protein
MEDTSQSDETRADVKTRWKKGQSGNLKGRLPAAGYTLTGLARLMMEQPVQGAATGERRTRLSEYMLDIVRRADAGDLKCRMFLLKAIDRGDGRKLTAQRNAKKAKTDELREFEAAKADEISPEPLDVAIETELVNTVSPTVPPRATNVSSPKKALPQRDSLLASSATLRRDPHTGNLLSPEGRVLSPEEEEQLLYPAWPHISPHLGKVPFAGDKAGDLAGPESPDAKSQAIDSSQEFSREKISQEFPLPGPDRKGTLH